MQIKGPSSGIRSLHSSESALNQELRGLSSGKRINRAGDDAAGLATARKLDAHEVSLSQAARNIADASSYLQVADGGLSEAHGIVSRLRELAVQAGNGALGTEQRGLLQQEASQLTEELSRIEATTAFNGQRVFQDGARLDIQTGDDRGESVAIDPGGSFVSPLGLDAIDLTSAVGAQDALGLLDAASTDLSGRQASLGASFKRFDVAASELGSSREGLIAARSRIEDADIAQTTAQSVAARIRAQAAVNLHGQANISSALLGKLYDGLG